MAPTRPAFFNRLQTRLTIRYAGLFALALIVLAIAINMAVTGVAKRAVRADLVANGNVFERLLLFRANQLHDGADLLSRDFGFRTAFASGDAETIRSAVDNLRERLGVDRAFVISADGAIAASVGGIDDPTADQTLVDALFADEEASGIINMGGAPYQAISAPIRSPMLAGWVVFAVRLDETELVNLQNLSAIELQASVFHRGPEGWTTAADLSDRDLSALSKFVEGAQGAPRELGLSEGAVVTLAKPLASMDPRSPNVLVLRYPLAKALAPYHLLLEVVAAVGLLGFAILVAGTWRVARGLTQPISALSLAVRRLQTGEDALVEAPRDDEVGRLAQSFNIMASEIRARERHITRLALHDSETDLPNRLALQQELEAARASGLAVFVASCGVERMAEVRGAIGYALWARLVGELGRRLADTGLCISVGRLSSDRLGAVYAATDAASAESIARQVVEVLERPVNLDGSTVDITLTVGLAGLPMHGEDAGLVMDRASIALDQARRRHANTAVFDETLYGEPAENLSLISDMQAAMSDGGMSVHYQPKLDLRQGRVTSAEALVRWTHPKRGPLSPDLFVRMAEETGHIRELTTFVLERSLADQQLLAASGFDVAISVNISGRLLGDEAYGRELLERVQKRTGPICFEITETAVIDNETAALTLLDALRAEGIEISIDDYGSGLSSLAYLKSIRAHELKIDRAFISELTSNERDALLVRSTIDLAHGLGMKVTAEGVEDDYILSLLTLMGCDQAQGFGFARPMPLADLITFLGQKRAHLDAPITESPNAKPSASGSGSLAGDGRTRLRSI